MIEKKWIWGLSLWLLAGICLNLNAQVQKKSLIQENLERYLQIQHRNLNFNGVVIIAKGDSLVAGHAIGLASHELQVPIRITSKFKIASITKSFTAFLITIAEHENKIELDDSIDKYFPEIHNPNWNYITIRQLLYHTSGIPHWPGIKNYWNVKSKLTLNDNKILNEIAAANLVFEPGVDDNYSSPGYYVLADILERVYSTSFDSLLERKVLKPYNLLSSGNYDHFSIIEDLVNGYHLITDDSLVSAPYRDISFLKGAGNMYANAIDLSRWGQLLMSDSLEKSFSDDLFLPDLKNSHIKDGEYYGRGWKIRPGDKNNLTTYHLGGGFHGFTGKIALYPKENYSLVIISNVSFLPLNDQLWKDLENIISGQPIPLPEVITELTGLGTDQLQEFSGAYKAENGMVLTVFFHNDRLLAKLGSNPPFELHTLGNDEFLAKKVNVKFLFNREPGKEVTSLKTEGRGRVDIFRKQ